MDIFTGPPWRRSLHAVQQHGDLQTHHPAAFLRSIWWLLCGCGWHAFGRHCPAAGPQESRKCSNTLLIHNFMRVSSSYSTLELIRSFCNIIIK